MLRDCVLRREGTPKRASLTLLLLNLEPQRTLTKGALELLASLA